ncbi:MAG: O-antigen ligase family protein [Schwartzia sp.]|nr:O-antigen ligase family protein [Schwartzia sp. (in: firmicutes)]
MERLRRITLEDAIFYALVVFAIGSCISGHLGTNAEKVALALCAIRLLRGNIPFERLRVAKNLAIVLVIFFGTMTISAFWSGDFWGAVSFFSPMKWAFEELLIFCVILCADREKRVGILWGAMFLSLFAVELNMIYDLGKGIFRPAGFLKAILPTSTLYTILLPPLAIFSLDADSGNKRQIACKGMMILGLAAVVAIGTRGIWLALLLTLPIVVYCRCGWKRSFRIVAACLALVVAVSMFLPDIRDRVNPEMLKHSDSISARIAMYEGVRKMFIDRPFLGVGMANFGEYWSLQYCPPDYPAWKQYTHPHNSFLNFLVSGGIVGFVGFWAVFGFLLWWSWRRRHTRRGLLLFGSTLSLLLYALTDTPLGSHEGMRVYWLTVGLAFAEEANMLEEQKPGFGHEKHSVD